MTTSPLEKAVHGAGDRQAGLIAHMARCIDDASGGDAPGTAELLSCLRLLGGGGDVRRDVPEAPAGAASPGSDRPARDENFPIQLGRFQLRGLLGAGGFGIVFRAFDANLDREVALKIPRPDAAVLPSLQARFIREAQAAAALDHPGIVPVYDAGKIGLISFISSALCQGPTLETWLRQRCAPPTGAAAELVCELALAVQHAHDRGVLHRDLKPSNVLLEPRGSAAEELQDFQPRIADFGLAKRMDSAAPHTIGGALVGTPRYMAPEQIEANGEAISVRTDVYALGVVLYELLAGAPPHVGDSDVQTMSKILKEEPRPPQRLAERIDRDLIAICLTCLRKNPAERYPSARELAEDLGRYGRGEPVVARPLTPFQKAASWCRRNAQLAAMGAAIALALLGGTAISAFYAARATARAQELQLQSARLSFHNGLDRCEQGEIAEGLHLMASGLSLCTGKSPELESEIREAVSLWMTELHRLESIFGHPSLVTAVAFTSDDKTLLTGCEDGRLRRWSVATRRELEPSINLGASITRLVASATSDELAVVCSDHVVRLWDAATWKESPIQLRHASDINDAAFSPNGDLLLTCCQDNHARIWRLDDGALLHDLVDEAFPAICGDWDPQGTKAFVGSIDRKIRAWDATTGKLLKTTAIGAGFADQLAVSPTGRHLAAAIMSEKGYSTLYLYGLDDGALTIRRQCKGHIRELCWDSAGRCLLSTGATSLNAADLFDPEAGSVVGSQLVQGGEVVCAAMSRRGRLLATGGLLTGGLGAPFPGEARLWSTRPGVSRDVLQSTNDPANGVWALALSPNGEKLAAGTHDGTVRVFDVANGRQVSQDLPHSSRVQRLAFNPDASLLAAGALNGEIKVWSMQDFSEAVAPLDQAKERTLWAVKFSPDGSLLVAGGDDLKHGRAQGKLFAWKLPGLRPAFEPLEFSSQVNAVEFYSNSESMLVGFEHSVVHRVDLRRTPPETRLLGDETGQWNVKEVKASPAGDAFVTGTWDSHLRAWSVATGQMIKQPLRLSGPVWSADFRADGKRLVAGCHGGAIHVISTASWRPVGPPILCDADVLGVAYFPDGGKLAASCLNGDVFIVELPSPERGDVEELIWRLEAATGMRTTPDGQFAKLDAADLQKHSSGWRSGAAAALQYRTAIKEE